MLFLISCGDGTVQMSVINPKIKFLQENQKFGTNKNSSKEFLFTFMHTLFCIYECGGLATATCFFDVFFQV